MARARSLAFVGVPPVIMSPSDRQAVVQAPTVQTHASASANSKPQKVKEKPKKKLNPVRKWGKPDDGYRYPADCAGTHRRYNAGMARILFPFSAKSFSRRSFLLSAAIFAASLLVKRAARD